MKLTKEQESIIAQAKSIGYETDNARQLAEYVTDKESEREISAALRHKEMMDMYREG